MKVKQSIAVALLVSLGFSKAGEWEVEKVEARINQVPDKVKRTAVPEEHQALYDELVANKGSVKIGDAEEAARPAKADKKSKRDHLPPLEPEAKPEKKKVKAPEAEAPAEPAKEKKSKKPSKADKIAKAAKAATTPSKKVERDAFGCAKGTISAKVNAVLTDEWQSEAEIAKAAKLDLDQARGRLYYAAEEEIIEYRRLIQYRLKPAGKKK